MSPTAVTPYLPLGGCSGRSRRPTLRSRACPPQVPRHTWCCPRAKVTMDRAQPGPWNAHLPVRLRHSARSTCSKRSTNGPTELARTPGRLVSRAPLFPTSSGYVATKVQVSSAVRQAPSLPGLPLETLTGAHRCSGHTFRATRAMYLAPCGIDVWRINPVAWPGLPCCLEADAGSERGICSIAGSTFSF